MTGGQGRRPLLALFVAALAISSLAACGSGSKSGSDQFRDQTGSPLLDFGEEASEKELEAGAEAVEAFLVARADENWPEACAQLSRAVLDKIEHLATSTTDLEDKSCPSFLGAFTRLTTAEREESAAVDPGSLRQRAQQGYLIYYGARKVVYAMPLSREGGAWKVASLSPKQLS